MIEQALLILLVALANARGFTRLGYPGIAANAGLFLATIALRSRATYQAAALFLAMSLQWYLLPWSWLDLPTVGFFAPFLMSSAVALPFAPTRQVLLGWIRHGRMDRRSLALVLLTGVASTMALLAWAFWTDHLGVGERMVLGFKELPRPLVLGVIVPAFALLNALAEEIVYRGVLLEALHRAFGRHWGVAIVLQATAFAAVHYEGGFPNGILGYAMTFVYGAMLGYLRLRTGGMRAPYVAHVVADLCIGYFLVFRVLG